jgi:hypothetical protein
MAPGSLKLSDVQAPVGAPQPELHGLLARFHVDSSESDSVNALALQFLSSRLEPSVVAFIATALRT